MLTDAHREHLRTSGLTDESIALCGFYSESTSAGVSKLLGRRWALGGGIAIPFYRPGEETPFFHRFRPDKPRVLKRGSDSRAVKYEQPPGISFAPYFPPRARANEGAWLRDVSRVVDLVEGEKKAALLDQLGYTCIGSTGVDCFHDKLVADEQGLWRLHDLILLHTTIAGRVFRLPFDADSNPRAIENVTRAAGRIAGMLFAAGAAKVLRCTIPKPPDVEKLGIDDYFVRYGEEATRRLLEQGEPVEPLPIDDALAPLSSVRAIRGAEMPSRLRMPNGYRIDRSGLWKTGEGAAGFDDIIEAGGPILIRRMLEDVETGEQRAEITFRRENTWVPPTAVDRIALIDSRAAVAQLGGAHGAPIDSTTASNVIKWLRAFEVANRNTIERARCCSRTGWHDVDGSRVFVLDAAVTPASAGPDQQSGNGDGDTQSLPLTFDVRGGRGHIAAALKRDKAGDLEQHLVALRRAWNASRVAATAICAAFAAPLLRPLQLPNFAVHLFGDSSRGKTSMLKIAASVYGAPSSEAWVASWNSTLVGMEYRAAGLCDLPLCYDEAGAVDAKILEQSIYLLVNGTGRTRGARTGGTRETPSWRTIVLSTGEKLTADSRAPSGAQARVLPLYVSAFGPLSASEIDELRQQCEQHHGCAGRAWIESAIDTDDWTGHRDAFRANLRAFSKRSASNGIAQRRAAFLTLLVITERLVHQALEIGQPDGSTMAAWFDREAEEREDTSPAATRALELVREWRQTTPQAFRDLTRNTAGQEVPQGSDARTDVVAYFSDDAVSFLPGALTARLQKEGMAYEIVARAWKDAGWLVLDAEGGRCTRQMRVWGSKVRVVAIRRGIFDGTEDDGMPGNSDGTGNSVPGVPGCTHPGLQTGYSEATH